MSDTLKVAWTEAAKRKAEWAYNDYVSKEAHTGRVSEENRVQVLIDAFGPALDAAIAEMVRSSDGRVDIPKHMRQEIVIHRVILPLEPKL